MFDKILKTLKNKIIIGSRGSDLALWQAHYISGQIKDKCNIDTEIKIIKTKGDQIQHLSFDKMEGKGFFTKEIEEALLKKEIDIAVHSFKDLETAQPEGLVIGAVSERVDPADIIIIRKEAYDRTQKFGFKKNAIIGTSSSRRKSQLLLFRPDVEIKDLRGNVPTRIDKLRQNQYDAILLAKAGLDRLEIDLNEFYFTVLDPTEFIPAPAQGVLAIQARSEDQELLQILKKINNPEVEAIVHAERSILKQFGGGCQVPLGIYATAKEKTLKIWISRSASWDKIPAQIYSECTMDTFSPHGFVNSLNIVPKSVFISSEMEHTIFERMLNEYGFKILATSLIDTKVIENLPSSAPAAEWIFFSSKNAVQYYLKKYTIHSHQKVAAIGQGTALKLKEAGFEVAFVADKESMQVSSEKFKNLVKGEKVLFPCAENSLKSFENTLDSKQVIHFPIYQTLAKPVKIEAHEIYVFTSPSNVNSFFLNNTLPSNAICIAMGESTGSVLEQHGVKNYHLPREAEGYRMSYLGLARLVLKVSN